MIIRRSSLLSDLLTGVFLVSLFWLLTGNASAAEWLFKPKISSRVMSDDNMFVSSLKHNRITGLIVTPQLDGVIKEANWNTTLAAKLTSNNYSDHNLNSNDQYLDFTGQYNAERNIFSLGANYALDSNLNVASADFAVVGHRINKRDRSLTPQYTRLLTERLALSLSYSYSDVNYLDAGSSGYTPYTVKAASASLIYNLSEKDKLTFSQQKLDFNSNNNLTTYTLLNSRIGLEHKFSKTLSSDILGGISRRNTTNLITRAFDFFGNIIVQTRKFNTSSNGFIFDGGVKKTFEKGSVEARISRSDTTDSFGGLNRYDTLKLNYNHRSSALWSYGIRGRYESVSAISTGSRSTDRQDLFLDTFVLYSLNRRWTINGSYRYIQRKYINLSVKTNTARSNGIYMGLTYNFPNLSTF